jgi:hypothetical protein
MACRRIYEFIVPCRVLLFANAAALLKQEQVRLVLHFLLALNGVFALKKSM